MGIFVLAFCLGIVAGLRALTAPALVSWAAHLGWLSLDGTPLAFMRSTIAVVIFSIAALGEIINDKLPKTPPRTALPSVVIRILTGGFSGACLALGHGASLPVGAVLGAIGAVVGTFAGYQVRHRLVSGLNVKDIFIAIPEDLIAIGAAYVLVSR